MYEHKGVIDTIGTLAGIEKKYLALIFEYSEQIGYLLVTTIVLVSFSGDLPKTFSFVSTRTRTRV